MREEMRNNKQKTMILTWRCSVCLDFPPAEKDVTSMYTNYHLSHCYVIMAKDILTTFLNLLIIYMSLFICNSRYWISIKYCILNANSCLCITLKFYAIIFHSNITSKICINSNRILVNYGIKRNIYPKN